MPTRKIADPKPSIWTKPPREQRPCLHPEHDPPKHRVYEPGTYEHECPACGKKTVFTVPVVTWIGDPHGGGTLRC